MRNPERIKKMLSLISRAWHRNPDLRLMQLLLNALQDPNFSGNEDGREQQLFYTEDNELAEALKKFYE